MPETKDETKVTVEKPVRKDIISSITIQSLFPARVIYIGPVSGKRYDFPAAGSTLSVDSRDVPAMLAYRIGTTNCCGGGNVDGNSVFQVI